MSIGRSSILAKGLHPSRRALRAVRTSAAVAMAVVGVGTLVVLRQAMEAALTRINRAAPLVVSDRPLHKRLTHLTATMTVAHPLPVWAAQTLKFHSTRLSPPNQNRSGAAAAAPPHKIHHHLLLSAVVPLTTLLPRSATSPSRVSNTINRQAPRTTQDSKSITAPHCQKHLGLGAAPLLRVLVPAPRRTQRLPLMVSQSPKPKPNKVGFRRSAKLKVNQVMTTALKTTNQRNKVKKKAAKPPTRM